MNQSEQEALRSVLEVFYDRNVVAGWEMNDSMLRVLEKMIESEKNCSDIMALIPEPPVMRPDFSYLKSYLKQISRNLVYKPSDREKVYLSCRAAAANKYKFLFDAASNGIDP